MCFVSVCSPGNDNQSDDNWKTVTNKNSVSKFPNYKYDAQKLANLTTPNLDQVSTDSGILSLALRVLARLMANYFLQKDTLTLGRPQGANSWRHGAGAPKKPATAALMDLNRSSALSG